MSTKFASANRMASLRRSRNRSLFFERMEERLNLSVTFLESEPTNDSSPGQEIIHPGLTSGVVDSFTPASGSVAAITNSSNPDWYNFRAAVPGELTIAVANLGGDPANDGLGDDFLEVTVRDNANAIIAGPTVLSGAGNNFSFTTAAANTTDLFKIEIKSNLPTDDADYQLRVRNIDADDVGGNGNTRATANNLGTFSGTTINVSDRTITRPDRDYYKLTAQNNGPIEVRIQMPAGTGVASGLNSPTNLGIRVRDAAGVVITSSNATETNVDTAQFTGAAGQTYFVEVYSGSLGQVNRYDLRVAVPGIEVHGFKYEDVNGDGFQDIGEPGLPNWQIYSDTNNNDAFDAGEPTADTGADGSYTLILPLGVHVIREVKQAGWTTTYPLAEDGGSHNVDVSTGLTLDHLDFGNFRDATIQGLKFNDLNNNSVQDTGELGLIGWTIFSDANNNGSLDGGEVSTVTASDGTYSLKVGPGTHKVREAQQANWIQTTTNPADITPTSGEVISNIVFGNFRIPTIAGQKFNDLNGNGSKDAGEPGLAAWTIYSDANNNGALDGGELSTTTDGNGDYVLQVTIGTHKIREVAQAGWVQTTTNPADIPVVGGQAVTGVNFGNFDLFDVTGTKFEDLNGNGVKDAGEPGLPNWTIYDDINDNGVKDVGEPSATTGATGTYTIADLGTGTHRIREVQQAGWIQKTANPADIAGQSGTNVSNVDFGNLIGSSIHGVKFRDFDGIGGRNTDLIQGDEPLTVFIIDISGSTGGGFAGTPVGDVNGDGSSNTILDA
ncbi:MAG: hypothetical protein O3C40_00535 [Planctomycetota bacterium]|nr:hypothetical protein [Planctomycetota bacterium]